MATVADHIRAIDPDPDDEMIVHWLLNRLVSEERWELTDLGRHQLSNGTPANGKPFEHPHRCDWCGEPARNMLRITVSEHGEHHFCGRPQCDFNMERCVELCR